MEQSMHQQKCEFLIEAHPPVRSLSRCLGGTDHDVSEVSVSTINWNTLKLGKGEHVGRTVDTAIREIQLTHPFIPDEKNADARFRRLKRNARRKVQAPDPFAPGQLFECA